MANVCTKENPCPNIDWPRPGATEETAAYNWEHPDAKYAGDEGKDVAGYLIEVWRCPYCNYVWTT